MAFFNSSAESQGRKWPLFFKVMVFNFCTDVKCDSMKATFSYGTKVSSVPCRMTVGVFRSFRRVFKVINSFFNSINSKFAFRICLGNMAENGHIRPRYWTDTIFSRSGSRAPATMMMAAILSG